MPRMLITVTAATILIAGTSLAQAQFNRSASVTGPAGHSVTSEGSAYCADGTCTVDRSTIGPKERSAAHQRSVTCTVPGQCASSGSYTGPAGGSITRNGSFTRK